MTMLLLTAALVLPPVTTPSASVRPAPVLPRPQPVLVQPIVVTAPAPTPTQTTAGRTWVPGRYVDQLLPNGQMLRVWVPGYWQ